MVLKLTFSSIPRARVSGLVQCRYSGLVSTGPLWSTFLFVYESAWSTDLTFRFWKERNEKGLVKFLVHAGADRIHSSFPQSAPELSPNSPRPPQPPPRTHTQPLSLLSCYHFAVAGWTSPAAVCSMRFAWAFCDRGTVLGCQSSNPNVHKHLERVIAKLEPCSHWSGKPNRGLYHSIDALP